MKLFNFLSEKKPVFVLGDSHTRCFSFNRNFVPLFVGEGKSHNFINAENAGRVEQKTVGILSTLRAGSNVLLFFGEPDTRFMLGKGWTPWVEHHETIPLNVPEMLNECISRQSQFLKRCKEGFPSIHFFVLSISPSVRPDQNEIVADYNKGLKEACENLQLTFIDFTSSVINNDGSLAQEYYGDPVHLNNRIQLLIENYFIAKKVLSTSYFNHSYKWDNKSVQGQYVFDERFGCFVQKSNKS